jgi:hypothetical protein
MNVYNSLTVFVAVILIKAVINLHRLRRCQHYLEAYLAFLKKPNWDLVEHKSAVIKLFIDSGIHDYSVPYMPPPNVIKATIPFISVMNQFPTHSAGDVEQLTIRMFHEAIGVYRRRIRESFSPMYWLDFLIHLPKKVLTYLSVPAESLFIKFAQIIWWIAAASVGILKIAYQSEIVSAIRNFFARISF